MPSSAVRIKGQHFLFLAETFTMMRNKVSQYESMRAALEPILGHTVHYREGHIHRED